jgi:drug/metabolite transporter (DMT)-like permease
MIIQQRGGPRLWPALIAVNIAAIIFGTTALFGRLEVSPVWIVAGRGFFAWLALCSVAAVQRLPLRLPARRFGTVALSALLLALHWIAFFTAVRVAGVAIGTLTAATFPLFTIVLEAMRGRRRPSAITLGAGATIIVAVALISGPDTPGTDAGLGGAGFGLVAALLFAVFALVSQDLAKETKAVILSMYQQGMVALLLLPVLPFVEPLRTAGDWIAIAALGVIGTALTHQLYLFALGRLPASVCGGFVTLEPVYAILFAAALFGDPVRPVALFSAVLIIGASLLLLRESSAVAITTERNSIS